MVRPVELSPAERDAAGRLSILAGILVALLLGLMVLGALVRAHGAGLACPDWPLCFGELVPQLDVQVGFEWTHRVLAGGIALLYAALATAILRRPALAPHCRGPVLVGGALFVVQILLGALTVWQLLAIWTVTSHLVTANLIAVTVALIAVRLRELARPPEPVPAPGPVAQSMLAVGGILLAAQVVLGGLVSSSYAGLACPDFPTCFGGQWLPDGPLHHRLELHLAHRWNGVALVGVLTAIGVALRRHPGLGRLAALLAGLGLAQGAVGIANVLLALPVEVTGLHSALAAALVLTTALTLRRGFAPGTALQPGAAGATSPACAPFRSSPR